MITAHDVMPMLVDVWPELGPVFEAGRWSWEPTGMGDDDRPGLHGIVQPVVNELMARLTRGETESFPALFDAFERILTEGDMYATDFITTGIMEMLHGRLLKDDLDVHVVDNWWGPKGRKWWEAEVTVPESSVMWLLVSNITGLWQVVQSRPDVKWRQEAMSSEDDRKLAAEVVVEQLTNLVREGRADDLAYAHNSFEGILTEGDRGAMEFLTERILPQLHHRLVEAGTDRSVFEQGMWPRCRTVWRSIVTRGVADAQENAGESSAPIDDHNGDGEQDAN